MTAGSDQPTAAASTVAACFAADIVCVLVFVAVGRRNHGEGITATGIAETAWPFLAGLVAAWVIYRAWRRPTAVSPTGISIWLTTVAVGMGLRAATGSGIAFSFILVATLVTGALLVGWRAAATALARRRTV